MTFKERISQAFWGGSEGEELPTSPQRENSQSTPGCFDPPSSKASPDRSEVDAAQQALREIEVALEREKKRSSQKDQELALLQQLLAKLESSIEQQAKDAQLEQDRISTLERTLAQQQAKQQAAELHVQPAEADEKIEKLLLAVAGEKQIAEERQRQINKLQDQLEEQESKRMCATEALSHLRQRVSEEEALRRAAERNLAEKQEELRKVQQHSEGFVLPCIDESPPQGHWEKEELKERLASQSEEIIGLKAQLMEQTRELAKEAIRERKSTRANSIGSLDSGEDFERLKSDRAMRLQKEHEVCDLQQQLAAELAKRREVLQQNIERERLVLEKDRQMVELQTEIATLRCQRMQRSSGALFDVPQVQLRALRNLESEDSFSDISSRAGMVDRRFRGASMQLSAAPLATSSSQPATLRCPPSPGTPLMTTPSVARRRDVGFHDHSAGGLVFNYSHSGAYTGVQAVPPGVGMAQQVVHRGFAWPPPGKATMGPRSSSGSWTYR